MVSGQPFDPRGEFLDGSIVSYSPVASSFGARVLKEGGNAVDAAVTTAIALAVTYPQAGNLAGGGFMLISTPDHGVHFLDYRETAPRRARVEMFVGADGKRNTRSLKGGLSVCVPGTIAGLRAALERFGTWSWDRILAPLIDLAERGDWLTTRQAAYLARFKKDLETYESSKRCFVAERGEYLPGTLFRQPDLAKTLRTLAERGPDDFYRGSIARLIAREIARDGGVLDLEDLGAYQPKWREPIRSEFFGREVYSSDLPSAGGLVLHLTLRLLEAGRVQDLRKNSVTRHLLMARCFRIAFAIRYKLASDPDCMTSAEAADLRALLSTKLTRSDVDRLERKFIEPANTDRDPDSNTTHFCVLDGNGFAVSNTYSLNTLFGSKLAVGGAGFLLNNSIDDFRITETPNWYGIVDCEKNQLAPGRRPVGSMTPTIMRAAPSGPVELIVGLRAAR